MTVAQETPVAETTTTKAPADGAGTTTTTTVKYNPLKSRKLWLAIIAAVVGFGNAFFGWGLTTEQVWSVVSPILLYIGVEGLADIKSR